jgi:hypothetical protein
LLPFSLHIQLAGDTLRNSTAQVLTFVSTAFFFPAVLFLTKNNLGNRKFQTPV